MKRKSLYLIFGILLLLGGLFGILLTVVAALDPQFGAGIAIAFGICSGAFLAPGVLLFYFYWRASAKDKVLQTVGAILRGGRGIGIQDVAGEGGGGTPREAGLFSRVLAAGGGPAGGGAPGGGGFGAPPRGPSP